MGKKLISTLLLVPLSGFAASEFWWLEMEPRFHAALIKRFSDGNAEACREVVEKLPDLVSAGTIKELEEITEGAESGGRIHPTGTATLGGGGQTIQTGSSYTKDDRTGLRYFTLQTVAISGRAQQTEVVTLGKAGKYWQPVFSVESEGSVRLLMERDSSAEQDFYFAKGLLELSASAPTRSLFTVFLNEGNPALPGTSQEGGGSSQIAIFRDVENQNYGNDVVALGTTLIWTHEAGKGLSFRLESSGAAEGSTTDRRQHWAEGTLDGPGQPKRVPLASFIEQRQQDGTYNTTGERDDGEIAARLVLDP